MWRRRQMGERGSECSYYFRAGRPWHAFQLRCCCRRPHSLAEDSSRSPFYLPPLCSRPAGEAAEVLPQQLLRTYITYAKQTCRPKLQAADYDKVASVSSTAAATAEPLLRPPLMGTKP